MRWCRTLLCFRLCISAVGTEPGSGERYTAVPGTRGMSALHSAGKASSGTRLLLSCAVRIVSARFQVVSMTNSTNPHASGNQPPSAIFVAFAAKNTSSSDPTSPNTRNSSGFGRFGRDTAATQTSAVVSTMVPDTAMP